LFVVHNVGPAVGDAAVAVGPGRVRARSPRFALAHSAESSRSPAEAPVVTACVERAGIQVGQLRAVGGLLRTRDLRSTFQPIQLVGHRWISLAEADVRAWLKAAAA